MKKVITKGKRSPRAAWAGLTLAAAFLGGMMGTAAPGIAQAAEAQAQTLTHAQLQSSIVRGGRLYDNWFKEINERAPEAAHPAYPRNGANAGDPGATWRCAECHGYDYKGKDGAYGQGSPHFTGIKGIRALTGAPVDKIIAVLKDKTHGYEGLMALQDFLDLAHFISQGQVEMEKYIDPATRLSKGDAKRHADYYKVICANCHGQDGLRIRSRPPFGEVVRDDPWKAFHIVLNGHPSETMPALRVLHEDVLVDILAYVQTLPTEEILSSVVRGGRLYDNWYKEIGRPAPKERHPAYPPDKAFAQDPSLNWRCAECHGYDYKGKDGAYGSGRHATGIKGVQGKKGVRAGEIMQILLDRNHQYDTVMDAHDRLDLANFIAQGQIDMDQYVDPKTRKAKGDPRKTEEMFGTLCASCHGLDGAKIPTMPPLGRAATLDPWLAFHRIANGHPAEKMPALRVLDLETQASILTYIQTLPQER